MRIILIAALLLVIVACETSNKKEVIIGSQTWMTRNLDIATFRNGDPLPEARTDYEWIQAGKEGRPAWCYYNNDPANGAKFGKLYNWYAVVDPRGLAPQGWHIPSDEEWTVLTDYLGGNLQKAGDKMKSEEGWNEEGNGLNSSGFSGLPGGTRYGSGPFDYIGSNGYWWSSTEGKEVPEDDNNTDVWTRNLYFSSGGADKTVISKRRGISVRCIKD